MTYDALLLLKAYARKGILVDTNILLLYFVGLVRRNRITQFNRTERFTPQDFDLLVTVLSDFVKVSTIPNILTEVSSFINQLGEPDRTSCYAFFALEIASLQEIYIPSQNIVSTDWYFSEFGLTDCGIADAAKQNQLLVLTDDAKVANFLRLQQIDTVNFDDLRAMR